LEAISRLLVFLLWKTKTGSPSGMGKLVEEKNTLNKSRNDGKERKEEEKTLNKEE
jgi:hypothetical protein